MEFSSQLRGNAQHHLHHHRHPCSSSYDHHFQPSITVIHQRCCHAPDTAGIQLQFNPHFNSNRIGLQNLPQTEQTLTRQEMLAYYALCFNKQSHPFVAMPFELDTAEISRIIKETMFLNGISQRVFAQAVLNLSQGTLSDLLNKPKPWSELSFKGKRPYVCMHLWLSDPLRFQKLNQWTAANQSSDQATVNQLLNKNSKPTSNLNATAASPAQYIETENENEKPEPEPKPELKRRRLHFTSEQKLGLMNEFMSNNYPKMSHLKCLAEQLSLDIKSVIIWFHNQRTRNKRQYLSSHTHVPAFAQFRQAHRGLSSPYTFSDHNQSQSPPVRFSKQEKVPNQ